MSEKRGTVVTVGAFDGIHVGHAALIRATVQEAQGRGLPSVVLTFSPHPATVLRPDRAPALLTTEDERREAIASLGVDRMVVLPFTHAVAQLTAREFVERVLIDRLDTSHLVIGHDHALGRDRVGDAAELGRLGAAFGFDVTTVAPVHSEEASASKAVSSSRVRAALEAGDVGAAASLLGRSYWLTGEVVHGEGRGARIGFPTANLAIPEAKLLPAPGIYAARAWVRPTSGGKDRTPPGPLDAALHVGPRPVFEDGRVTVEAHLIDRRVELYGATMRLELVGRIRGVENFDSVAELVAAMGRDVVAAKEAIEVAFDDPTAGASSRRSPHG